MGKWGKVDFRQIKQLQKQLEKLESADIDRFCEECAKELAARLLRKTIKRTPVGEYDKPVKFTTKDGKDVSFTPKSGKKGGTLRRGWTSKSQKEAESGKKASAKAYADSLTIHHYGNTLVIEIVNPVEYASYVEYGHRTANHKGWVQGRYMLTMSIQELQQQSQAIIEKKLTKFLGDVFRD